MICPVCKIEYRPILKRPENDNRLIQDIFPKSTPEEREQLISGICSNRCWDKLFEGNGEDE